MFVYIPTEENLRDIAKTRTDLIHVVAVCEQDSATFYGCESEALACGFVGALARRQKTALPYNLSKYR